MRDLEEGCKKAYVRLDSNSCMANHKCPTMRDYRLDLLKALAMLLVLFWHLQPVKVLASSDRSAGSFSIVSGIVQAFNYQITLIAVPSFLIVSLYLFLKRSETSNSIYHMIGRIRRPLKLFIFWAVVQCSFWFATKNLFPNHIMQYDQSFVWRISWFDMLVFGGPALPFVGDSVFYYLSALILLMLIVLCYLALSDRARKIVGWTIVVASLVYFELAALAGYSLPYWRIDCFVVYIPITYFAVKSTEYFLKARHWYLLGYILFSLQDLIFIYLERTMHVHLGFGQYGRISVVLGATTMASMALSLSPNFRTNLKSIHFLGSNTLGIFAIHKYFQMLFTMGCLERFNALRIIDSFWIGNVNLSIVNLACALLTVVVTIFAVGILRNTFLKPLLV